MSKKKTGKKTAGKSRAGKSGAGKRKSSVAKPDNTLSKRKRNDRSPDNREDGPRIQQVPAVFTITSVEQLQAVASSKRQKILAEFIDNARTTKQVAERLGQPATRLYHHVDALVKHGILVLEKESPKRGTVERYYRAAGRQFRVDDACLTDSRFQDEHSRFVSKILGTAKNRLLESLSAAAAGGQPPHTTVASAVIKATDKEIEQISEQLVAHLENDQTAKSTRRKAGVNDYRVVLLIYPDQD